MEKAVTKISTKSWHYRLMKLVFGSEAPTPQTMHNLCPYFWLIIASILLSPLVLPSKGLFSLFGWIADGLARFAEMFIITPAAESWKEKLTDLDVYQIYNHNLKISKMYKKIHKGSDNYRFSDDFAVQWFEETYNKKAKAKIEGSHYETYTTDFTDWHNECQEEMRKIENIKYKELQETVKYEARVSKFRDNVDSWLEKISKKILSFTYIIKWTKRIVGLLITSVGLIATYFVVNFLSRGVLYVIENWDWEVVLILGIVIGAAAFIVGVFALLKLWVNYIAIKGLDLWYTKAVYYPIYVLVYYPLKIVLYYFLWHLVLVNAWFLLKGSARLLWGSLLGFLGIFGEYFGASYTDYCPGIEWDDEK